MRMGDTTMLDKNSTIDYYDAIGKLMDGIKKDYASWGGNSMDDITPQQKDIRLKMIDEFNQTERSAVKTLSALQASNLKFSTMSAKKRESRSRGTTGLRPWPRCLPSALSRARIRSSITIPHYLPRVDS